MITILLYILSFNTSTFSEETNLRWVTPTTHTHNLSLSFDGKYILSNGFGSFNIIDADSNKIVWREFFKYNNYITQSSYFSHKDYNFHISDNTKSFIYNAEKKELIKKFNPNEIIKDRNKLKFIKWDEIDNSMIFNEDNTNNYFKIFFDNTFEEYVFTDNTKIVKNSINEDYYYDYYYDSEIFKNIFYVLDKENNSIIDSVVLDKQKVIERIDKVYKLDSNSTIGIYLVNFENPPSYTPSLVIYNFKEKEFKFVDSNVRYFPLKIEDKLNFVNERGEVRYWNNGNFEIVKTIHNFELINYFLNEWYYNFNDLIVFLSFNGNITIADFETEEVKENIQFFNRSLEDSFWTKDCENIIVRGLDTLAKFDLDGNYEIISNLSYNSHRDLVHDNQSNIFIVEGYEISKYNLNFEKVDSFVFESEISYYKTSFDKNYLLVYTQNEVLHIINLENKSILKFDKIIKLTSDYYSAYDISSDGSQLIIFCLNSFYIYDLLEDKLEVNFSIKNNEYHWKNSKFIWLNNEYVLVEKPNEFIGLINLKTHKYSYKIPDKSKFENENVEFYYFIYLNDNRSYLLLSNEGFYQVDIYTSEIIDKINTPQLLKDYRYEHYNLSPDMTKLFFAMRNGVGMFDLNMQLTSVEKYEKLEIEVFPNPTNDILNINNTQNNKMDLMLVNSLGLTLQDFTLNPNSSLTLNLESYQNGMYILKDQNSGATYKFIIYK